jgi:cation transport ATPase
MDEFKELERYKELLDAGTISDDYFSNITQKLLGLKTDEEKALEKEQERNKALGEIEKMRAEEIAKKEEEERIRKAQEREEEERRLEQERQEYYERTYVEEKAKEKARLEAFAEEKQKKKAEQMENITNATRKAKGIVKIIILWILAVFCLLCSISGLGGAFESLIFDYIGGIVMLLLAIMACPIVTDKTKELPQLSSYYKYKKCIVTVLVIIYIIMFFILQ